MGNAYSIARTWTLTALVSIGHDVHAQRAKEHLHTSAKHRTEGVQFRRYMLQRTQLASADSHAGCHLDQQQSVSSETGKCVGAAVLLVNHFQSSCIGSFVDIRRRKQ